MRDTTGRKEQFMTTFERVRDMTQDQRKDIATIVIGAIPDLTFDEAQALIGDKGKLVTAVCYVFSRWKKTKLKRQSRSRRSSPSPTAMGRSSSVVPSG